MLHDMMHNEVEVYVDDMIVKSKDKEGHIIKIGRASCRERVLELV